MNGADRGACGSTCSSTTGPGECLSHTCAGDTDCAACEKCVASSCQTLPAAADAGASVASCLTNGY